MKTTAWSMQRWLRALVGALVAGGVACGPPTVAPDVEHAPDAPGAADSAPIDDVAPDASLVKDAAPDDVHDASVADSQDAAADVVGPDDAGTGDTSADAATDAAVPLPDAVVLSVPATAAIHEGMFSTSPICATCHSNSDAATAMRDAAGRPIAPYDLWAATMMANASRDPYWRAAVSAEIARTPAAADAIRAKCTRCHMPMAATQAARDGDDAPAPDRIFESSGSGDLARDGVSCTLCHQVREDTLGAEESFGGGFVVDDTGELFGPHGSYFVTPMVNYSGYTPVTGAHVMRSALCGTCHTLMTATLDVDGEPTGDVLPEQTPYLEWRTSAYSDEMETPGPLAQTCQGCHLLRTDEDGAPIVTRVARRPDGKEMGGIAPREGFGRHLFVGANTLIPQMIRDNRAALAPGVSQAAFDAVIAATRDQLANRTATLRLELAEGAGLAFDVAVTNLAGHKLPTAYPSRRMWLRVRVRDAQGQLLWESGETDDGGRLLGPVGAPLPAELAGGPMHPHRDIVAEAAQVPVWESVMEDAAGAVTYSLLRGARYAKDDRVLPLGWDAAHPDAARTAPVGTADDPDFAPGEDTVHYRLALAAPPGSIVEATLLFQPVSPRHVAELLTVEAPEVAVFGKLWSEADRTPDPLASATLALP